jgi:fructokinase
MDSQSPLLGGIEAGGTKFVLAVGSSPTHITARHTIPTTTPEETLCKSSEWFEGQGRISSLGIASFGPVELDKASSQWGHITNTPKAGWQDSDITGYFRQRLGVEVGFDTDVNGAALAEYRHGAGKDGTLTSLAYITVGTGIGGGLVINSKPVHGAGHPEIGHIFPRRHPSDLTFAGLCPHHQDCLEGLASGPAISERWGKTLSDLPLQHEAHDIVAYYLGQLCHTLFAATSVEVIVLGGGVMRTDGLLERVQQQADQLDRSYLPGQSKKRIVAPELGDNAGIVGALILSSR